MSIHSEIRQLKRAIALLRRKGRDKEADDLEREIHELRVIARMEEK